MIFSETQFCTVLFLARNIVMSCEEVFFNLIRIFWVSLILSITEIFPAGIHSEMGHDFEYTEHSTIKQDDKNDSFLCKKRDVRSIEWENKTKHWMATKYHK